MQALTDTQMKQMKRELQARLEKVLLEYFKQKNENVIVKDLGRFINTTIRYEYMQHKNNCFTVRISAKVDDTIYILHNDAVSGIITGAGAVTGCVIGSVVRGPFGMVAGAALGTVLGNAVGSAVAGGKARKYKDSFTAEEIFQLLATDGFEKQDGWVKCTVRLT